MSKLGCVCGHIIRDQTDAIPYKASLLPDVHYHSFFNWIADETQSYLEALNNESVNSWLLERGYEAEYVQLNQNHGSILEGHIHSKYLEYRRDMYQCTRCHRILIQLPQSQLFATFQPNDELSQYSILDDKPNTMNV